MSRVDQVALYVVGAIHWLKNNGFINGEGLGMTCKGVSELPHQFKVKN